MKTPIKNFAHALTNRDYERLFALYPVSDFEQDVQNYDARKSKTDPVVSVHYFRVSRILRDMMFTCSSIDFGSELSRQSKAENPSFPGVRLYDLNQSMLTPMFHGAGMPWLGAVHGSDLDYLYNNVVPREHMAEQDRELSDWLLASFLNFAYTGDPNWPEAFPQSDSDKIGSSPSSGINLQVVGGPYGTGSGQIGAGQENSDADLGEQEGIQNPLTDSLQYGEMGSEISQERQKLLEHEKLIKRCAFINSLAEKLGH